MLFFKKNKEEKSKEFFNKYLKLSNKYKLDFYTTLIFFDEDNKEITDEKIIKEILEDFQKVLTDKKVKMILGFKIKEK